MDLSKFQIDKVYTPQSYNIPIDWGMLRQSIKERRAAEDQALQGLASYSNTPVEYNVASKKDAEFANTVTNTFQDFFNQNKDLTKSRRGVKELTQKVNNLTVSHPVTGKTYRMKDALNLLDENKKRAELERTQKFAAQQAGISDPDYDKYYGSFSERYEMDPSTDVYDPSVSKLVDPRNKISDLFETRSKNLSVKTDASGKIVQVPLGSVREDQYALTYGKNAEAFKQKVANASQTEKAAIYENSVADMTKDVYASIKANRPLKSDIAYRYKFDQLKEFAPDVQDSQVREHAGSFLRDDVYTGRPLDLSEVKQEDRAIWEKGDTQLDLEIKRNLKKQAEVHAKTILGDHSKSGYSSSTQLGQMGQSSQSTYDEYGRVDDLGAANLPGAKFENLKITHGYPKFDVRDPVTLANYSKENTKDYKINVPDAVISALTNKGDKETLHRIDQINNDKSLSVDTRKRLASVIAPKLQNIVDKYNQEASLQTTIAKRLAPEEREALNNTIFGSKQPTVSDAKSMTGYGWMVYDPKTNQVMNAKDFWDKGAGNKYDDDKGNKLRLNITHRVDEDTNILGNEFNANDKRFNSGKTIAVSLDNETYYFTPTATSGRDKLIESLKELRSGNTDNIKIPNDVQYGELAGSTIHYSSNKSKNPSLDDYYYVVKDGKILDKFTDKSPSLFLNKVATNK